MISPCMFSIKNEKNRLNSIRQNETVNCNHIEYILSVEANIDDFFFHLKC